MRRNEGTVTVRGLSYTSLQATLLSMYLLFNNRKHPPAELNGLELLLEVQSKAQTRWLGVLLSPCQSGHFSYA